MAGDDRAAKPIRDQIAVVHAGAPDYPGRLIGQTAHHEGMSRFRHYHGRIKLVDLDLRADRGW